MEAERRAECILCASIKKKNNKHVANVGWATYCWFYRADSYTGVYLAYSSPRVHLHVVGMLWFMSCPLRLIRSCVYFCLYGPFNCISFHKFSKQFFAFSLCSSRLISALLVLSTIYCFMKVYLTLI